MAAGRKATGNRDSGLAPPLAVPDNRPHTGPGARTRKGKLDAMTAVTAVTGTGTVVNGPKDARDWYGTDWDQAEKDVRRLRQRIFAASQAGDLKQVRNLQRMMLRSRANAVVGVRRVTEVNAGRGTPGIDGKVALMASRKAELADWASAFDHADHGVILRQLGTFPARERIAGWLKGSPCGKRDYAIILLVTRLGLRSIDVRRLEFSDFGWPGSRLSAARARTGRKVQLPLLKDVGWAVIDYIRAGRPASDCPHVFLRHTAPVGPFSEQDHLHQILVRHARAAHVPVSEERRRGMHSLRHTLATRLMEEGTPAGQIAGILGRQSVQSAGVYLKSSPGLLARCALDPDAPAEGQEAR